ncbi:MAG: DsbC family protein [Pseudomonadales bacterium]|nr:DsbC family protein [Pseudomonadales bacterium]
MKSKIAVFLIAVFTSLASHTVFADAVADKIQNRIETARPGLLIRSVSKSEVQGLYEVVIVDGQKIYASESGDYLLAGELYKVTNVGLLNLTQQSQNESRAAKIAAIDENDMVIFSPESPKATITVFTDSDCGYCRKLHRDVPKLNEMGIAVRYLAFPRAGVDSPTYNQMVSAWCAEDKLDAMNRLKTGKKLPGKNCENPIEEQYKLGQMLGVRGTPALVLENGRLLPGYLEPARMAQAVGLSN